MAKDFISIISFYKFHNLSNSLVELKNDIAYFCKKNNLLGTVLLAKEGINGFLSGEAKKINALINDILKNKHSITDLVIKTNEHTKHPFQKLKIKIKKEIVSMGVENLDVESLKGKYIKSKDWDEFIKKENVVVVDARNDYEIKFGTFQNSTDPNTKTFKEFPTWVENNKELFKGKDIAMFCTGGIRCEKTTAYMKSIGYDNVFHLYGGILQYLEDMKNDGKTWTGECFVFDERISVDSENLKMKS